MKIFHQRAKRNVGDTLAPIILRHVLPDIAHEIVEEGPGKLLGVGSILTRAESGDTVWGTGAMYESDALACAPDVRFLAVRGKLTREIILRSMGDCPEVFGDPGLLVSRFIPPAREKRFKVGIVPHYVDYAGVGRDFGWSRDRCLIDTFFPLAEFVERITSCERIVASSLHALVIAESYGIPAEWAVWSAGVYGNGFKFRDYLTGTGRPPQEPGVLPPIEDLSAIQSRLVAALRDNFDQMTPRPGCASHRCPSP
jgi:pyruvyltransferase